jgi:hypothetical protein
MEVRDASGNIIPPNVTVPQHHLGFRFFRLAQVTDDLFDAYRNTYLAFELLLSSRFPKRREREIDWLKSSLTSSDSDLGLSNLGTLDHIVDAVYTNARLPLFHAKDGHAYFASPDVADRETVGKSLELLTRIVIRMAEAWYDTRRIGGGVNLAFMEQRFRDFFDQAQFVATHSIVDRENLSPPDTIEGMRFGARWVDDFFGRHRPHIHGSTKLPQRDDAVGAIYVVNDEAVLITHAFDATLDVGGFDALETHYFIRQSNTNQPRTLYPR